MNNLESEGIPLNDRQDKPRTFRFWDSSDALMFFVRFLVWFSKDPGGKEEQQM